MDLFQLVNRFGGTHAAPQQPQAGITPYAYQPPQFQPMMPNHGAIPLQPYGLPNNPTVARGNWNKRDRSTHNRPAFQQKDHQNYNNNKRAKIQRDDQHEDEEAIAAKNVVIVNESPEEIAKWIEERRKRFPTKETVQKRKEEQKQKMEEEKLFKHDRKRSNARNSNVSEKNSRKKPCTFFLKSGRCKYGNKCRYSHAQPSEDADNKDSCNSDAARNVDNNGEKIHQNTAQNNEITNTEESGEEKNVENSILDVSEDTHSKDRGAAQNGRAERPNKRDRRNEIVAKNPEPSLLEKLLAKQIAKERDALLQCFEHIEKLGWLDT